MGLLGDIGGIVGSFLDRDNANKMAAADRDFQREVYQNQLQWKAADAKKAGLHPLAALGGGTYSASPSSVPSSSFAQSLGKLGDGIGDAFNAYKNKEQIAKEAAWQDEQKQMARDEHDAKMRESASKVLMNNGMALEATRRAASYTTPMATGREFVPGQVDAPSDKPKPMLQRFRKPDGSLTLYRPTSEYKELYEDTPFDVMGLRPHFDALYWDAREAFSRR